MDASTDAERQAAVVDAAMVDAAVALFGVPIQPSWRVAALQSFATIATAAAFVAAFPLDDEAEPAPVFHP